MDESGMAQLQRSVPRGRAEEQATDTVPQTKGFGRFRSFLLTVSGLGAMVGVLVMEHVLASGSHDVPEYLVGTALAAVGGPIAGYLLDQWLSLATATRQQAENLSAALAQSRQREVPTKKLDTLTIDAFATLIQEAQDIISKRWTSPGTSDASAHAQQFLDWVNENLGEALTGMVNPGGNIATCGDVRVARDELGFLVSAINGWHPISGTILMSPAYFAMLDLLNYRGVRLSVVSSTESQPTRPGDFGAARSYPGYGGGGGGNIEDSGII